MEGLIKQHVPLYLKYRPQSLGELVGQDAVKRTLLNAIKHNRLSHAFLFMGPRGTGKTSTARILAKSINCIHGPTNEPCQTCASCLEVAAGTSPAVFEIDAASNNSVDDARALIEKAPLLAAGGRYKLYIIDECHMLSREAFNALLKTLEEPPPNVIFVLATTEEHKVPPTIVSRCQKLIFRLLNQETIVEYLKQVADKEALEIEPEAIELIARQARGGMRDALGMLDQASLLSAPGQKVSVADLLNLLGFVPEDTLLMLSSCMLRRDGKGIMECAQYLLKEGREPSTIVAELAKHCLNLERASFVDATAAPEASAPLLLGSTNYIKSLIEQSHQFDHLELASIVEQLDRLELVCRRSTQPALHLEVGLLSICHRNQIPLLQDLSDRLRKLEQKELPQTQVRKAVAPPPTSPQGSASASSQPAPPTLTKAAPTKQTEGPVDAPASPSQTTPDLESFWLKLISMLEDRHRPTWSLVSTHAFPVDLTANGLTIGVLKEQFQKMIEGKADHIRAAVEAILGHSASLRVRVMDNPTLSKIAESQISAESGAASSAQTLSASRNRPTTAMKQPGNKGATGDPSNTLKEAYRLFEGPGSRQIG